MPTYKPGTGGKTESGLYHYRYEQEAVDLVDFDPRNIKNVENLDGNAELFLALQDLSMLDFTSNYAGNCFDVTGNVNIKNCYFKV